MFDMDLPWWEFVVRGLAVYMLLLVMVRLSGHRTVGQFTPFDLLVVMLLSEAVSNSLVGGDTSLIGGLVAAATLVAVNSLVALASSRSAKFEKLVDGDAVLIGRDGEFFDKVVRRCRLSETDLEEALREHDCPREEMKRAFLEADGQISILRKPQ
ncbi:DUF421 domain-containing protein [Massilia yuzhufengensis]|uniref:YetF C-terminal domain-containing protein n=1 Tax=Massilia yuzhufengensis TaxID=1164594 RepID=A0A1I1HFN6_9BURK|nr:YetF domain-containing protein [Massilia yuzhufengensis]SFC22392.1 Protein of unknown function [Massilia yuzhufengensis]